MGAQWIHGEENNVVYELASSRKLTCGSSAFDSLVYARSSGEIVEPDSTCRMLEICSNVIEPRLSENDFELFKNCGELYLHS